MLSILPSTVSHIERFCASGCFLTNVRKVGRFLQNFVQKMMQKVSAVNFCTPYQLSKTRLAPSCSAFDAEHSATWIEISAWADFLYTCSEVPKHMILQVFATRTTFTFFCENLKNRISALISASESRPVLFDTRTQLVCPRPPVFPLNWRWHTDRYVTAVTSRCRKMRVSR